MRITFSTKPLYDHSDINVLLHHYGILYGHLLKLEAMEKKEIPKDSVASPFSMYSSIKLAKERGLKNIDLGGKLLNDLERKIKELFPESVPSS